MESDYTSFVGLRLFFWVRFFVKQAMYFSPWTNDRTSESARAIHVVNNWRNGWLRCPPHCANKQKVVP